MKKIYLILLLVALASEGCANPNTLPDQTKEIEENNSEVENPQKNEVVEEVEQEVEEEIAEETHLKLTELVDCAPFYSMSFQKIEGGTGKTLLFEGNTEIADQKTVGPDHVAVEPEEDIWEIGYAFDGEENLADTVTLNFWNRGGAKTLHVILDGLEYELPCPKMNPKEISIGQKLDGTQIVLENAKIYPNALLLRLSGVNNENWEKPLFLFDIDTEEKISPVRSAYEEEMEEMDLLFAFENGIPQETLVLRMKDRDSKGGELFYDLALELE